MSDNNNIGEVKSIGIGKTKVELNSYHLGYSKGTTGYIDSYIQFKKYDSSIIIKAIVIIDTLILDIDIDKLRVIG